jgi:hypothetical protein
MDVDPFAPCWRRPASPTFRLRRGQIFWRVAIVTFLVLELVLYFHLRRAIPFRPRGRWRRIVHLVAFAPQFACTAAVIGAGVVLACEVAFRLVVRPLMVRWYNPQHRDPGAGHPMPFFLKAGERVLDEMPARLVDGPRRRPPGTLVRTTHGLYFYPFAWDLEPWMVPEGHLDRVQLRTPARRVLYWVEGYPDNLVVRDDSGEETAFVVPDPHAALAWFAATARAPHLALDDVA